MTQGIQRREHFRIRYPLKEQPQIVLSGITYEVIDLSESGVRLKFKSSILGPKSKVSGTIEFADKSSCKISGNVLRITEKNIIIKFDLGVPYAKILSEQRRLIQKYGNLD